MIRQTAWERRERENNSHEHSVTFLSEEKKLSRGRESSQTDTLFTFGADIPLPPHRRRCPPSANRPNGSVMTALRCQPAEVCSVDAAVRAGFLTTNSPPRLPINANQLHAGKCVCFLAVLKRLGEQWTILEMSVDFYYLLTCLKKEKNG